MRSLLVTSLIFLISSCAIPIKPTDMIYQIGIVEGKACYYDNIKDLEKKDPKKVICKEFKEFDNTWYLINIAKWREILNKGIDQLIIEKSK
jgi:hypothetical protein